MILISTSPNGIRLTRGTEAYTATNPAVAAVLIRRLTTPAPAVPATPAAPTTVAIATPMQLGSRLAQVRALRQREI